ncbi:MAG TPA: glycosyltransferase [Gammaproteobacteria bacterium]|nr:glycosyltransferase [Gammaproteobacteria bacterium]
MTTRAAGDVWKHTVELVRQLGALGCETTIAVVSGELGEDARLDAARLTNVDLRVSPYASDLRRGRNAHAAREWLERLAEESGPDLLHANDCSSATARVPVPILLVVHECGAAAPATARSRSRGPSHQVVVAALERAERIVAPTSACLAATLMRYPEADVDGRDCVIHPGIDAGRRLGVKEPIGDGCRSEVFASTASHEPFGYDVLEAALGGRALVLGDVPSRRELWDGAAIFVDPNDERALARVLERLRADPSEARLRGEAARSRAFRYSARTMALAYVEAYAAMLDEHLVAVSW